VRDLGLPVKFIGVGERIDDLREFDPTQFVDALLGNDASTAQLLKEKANRMMSVVSVAVAEEEGGAEEGRGTTGMTPSARLQAAFQQNNNNDDDGGAFGVTGSLQISPPGAPLSPGEGGGDGNGSSKRKKRAKPQQAKKKKIKKDKK
jgi:hypothetical protein